MAYKPWKDLQFIREIVIKPEDPKNPMWVEFKDDIEWEDVSFTDSRIKISHDRAIKLGANTMYNVHMDYPEEFKKLVVATGDLHQAHAIYKQLQKKAPENWADYAEENVW